MRANRGSEPLPTPAVSASSQARWSWVFLITLAFEAHLVFLLFTGRRVPILVWPLDIFQQVLRWFPVVSHLTRVHQELNYRLHQVEPFSELLGCCFILLTIFGTFRLLGLIVQAGDHKKKKGE